MKIEETLNQFESASTLAGMTDWTFMFIFVISAILLFGITAFMVFCCVRYSRKRNPKASNIHGDAVLETIWTVVPTILVMFMFWYGWSGYKFAVTPPDDAFEITVIAKQWDWNFVYPRKGSEGTFAYGAECKGPTLENKRETIFPGEKWDELVDKAEYPKKLWETWRPAIVVPINTPIKIQLLTKDVVHSFAVPAFRIKNDCMPKPKKDVPNFVWFEATKLGLYDINCTEFCGAGHSQMSSYVRVVTQEEFDQWWHEMTMYNVKLEESNPGYVLYKNDCASCHSIDGTKIMGPPLDGLTSRTRTVITDKGKRIEHVKADFEYVKESLLNAKAKIVEGYPSAMVDQKLTEEQIKQLYEYIDSLK